MGVKTDAYLSFVRLVQWNRCSEVSVVEKKSAMDFSVGNCIFESHLGASPVDHTTIPQGMTEPSLRWTLVGVTSVCVCVCVCVCMCVYVCVSVCVFVCILFPTCDGCLDNLHAASLPDQPLRVGPELVVEGGKDFLSLHQRDLDQVSLIWEQAVEVL